MTEQIRPFSSGSQYRDWQSSNCERCKKFPLHVNPEKCEIDYAIIVAHLDDGTVSVEIAQRMGYYDNRGSYVWKCPEVEWTEEWKKEFLSRKEQSE